MKIALELANKAKNKNEIPVGAVIVKNDEIIGMGHNAPISSKDTTSHAEINAIRNANKKIGNYRLVESSIYVTLEPCLMCLGAIMNARIPKIIFGAYDSNFSSFSMLDFKSFFL